MSDWQLVDSSFCGSGDGEEELERSVSRLSISTTKAELSMDDWPDVNEDEAGSSSSIPSPSSTTQRQVRRDVQEIRMFDSFVVSDCDFGGGTRIWLRVGWPVKLLDLDDEQCAAWSERCHLSCTLSSLSLHSAVAAADSLLCCVMQGSGQRWEPDGGAALCSSLLLF
jgi:hypothetical protein